MKIETINTKYSKHYSEGDNFIIESSGIILVGKETIGIITKAKINPSEAIQLAADLLSFAMYDISARIVNEED